MKRLVPGIAALMGASLMLLSLHGCGGISSGPGGPPTEQTKTRVQRSLELAQYAMSFSGVQSPLQALSLNGRGAGEIPVSFLGGFMRQTALVSAGDVSILPIEEPGGENDPGWSGDPGFYYDEWLGLWVEVQNTSNGVTFLLYEDEQKTRRAGHITTTFPENTESYPQVYRSEYEFLGPRGFYETKLESETTGTMRYENESSAFGKDTGSASWRDGRYEWSHRHEGKDGFWSEDFGSFASDGSGTTRSRNSLGYRTTFKYRADGSGEGVIEGPDPGLPATITWDAQGNVRIVWADGTVEEYNWFGWSGGNGGDGSEDGG